MNEKKNTSSIWIKKKLFLDEIEDIPEIKLTMKKRKKEKNSYFAFYHNKILMLKVYILL